MIWGGSESTTENGGAPTPDHCMVFGFVDQMPSGGLVSRWVVDSVAYMAGAGAQAVGGVQATTWIVGGVSYSVIPATNFNDFFGSLDAGSTAVVNSYKAADGTLVATRIRGLTLTPLIFMPAVRR
jgi:hypothetical protein